MAIVNRKIARDLILLAKRLIGSDYLYDPEHKLNPGKGFHKTNKGWSNSDGRKRNKNTERNGKEEDSANRARSKSPNQRSNDFRSIQRASLSMDDERKREFHSGCTKPNGGLLGRLSGVLRRELGAARSRSWNNHGLLNPKTGQEINFYEGVPASLFHDTFAICQNYLENGDCVDVHSKEDYKDCTNYLSEDGLSGFSISPDGDLISVYNLNPKGGFLKTIAPIVKEKCKTLDCFNSDKQPLPKFYSRAFGFKTASVLDFNYGVLVEDKGKEYADHFVKTYGEAPVHFMVNSEVDVEVKHFNKDQWEEAKAYQESIAYPGGKSKKTSSILKPVNMPWRVWIYKG